MYINCIEEIHRIQISNLITIAVANRHFTDFIMATVVDANLKSSVNCIIFIQVLLFIAMTINC